MTFLIIFIFMSRFKIVNFCLPVSVFAWFSFLWDINSFLFYPWLPLLMVATGRLYCCFPAYLLSFWTIVYSWIQLSTQHWHRQFAVIWRFVNQWLRIYLMPKMPIWYLLQFSFLDQMTKNIEHMQNFIEVLFYI